MVVYSIMKDRLREVLRKLYQTQIEYKKLMEIAEKNILWLRQHEIELETLIQETNKIIVTTKPFRCYYCDSEIAVKEGVCAECVEKISVEDKIN